MIGSLTPFKGERVTLASSLGWSEAPGPYRAGSEAAEPAASLPSGSYRTGEAAARYKGDRGGGAACPWRSKGRVEVEQSSFLSAKQQPY